MRQALFYDAIKIQGPQKKIMEFQEQHKFMDEKEKYEDYIKDLERRKAKILKHNSSMNQVFLRTIKEDPDWN